jgi:hypothetical protein
VDFLHLVTQRELAAAFTEWDRRFREEPERFEAESVRLLRGTPETYGDCCAPYLISIICEQRSQAGRIGIGSTVMFVHAGVNFRGAVMDITPEKQIAHVAVLGCKDQFEVPVGCCSPV